MSDQIITNQNQKFCPEVERPCMGWIGGECSFSNNLHDAIRFQFKQQSPIGDTPILKEIVRKREDVVREKYDVVAVQLAQVVLSAGRDFTEEQCQPVKIASGFFGIVPVGKVGILPPDPRMSSRAIYFNYSKDDDQEKPKKPKKSITIPRLRVFDTTDLQPIFLRKHQ